MIKAIVFDWGGVLIDSPDGGFVNFFAKHLGVTEKDLESELIKYKPLFQMGKILESDMWEKICTKMNVSLPTTKTLWKDAVKELFVDKEKMFSLVQRLKKGGYKIGFLSNTEIPAREYFMENGYITYFDAIVFSCDEGLVKPEEEIYKTTLNRLGVKAEEVVFVDDLEMNVEGARKVGMKGVVFEDYERLIEKLKSLGVEV